MFSSVLFRLKFHWKKNFFCIHIKWNNKQPLIISRDKQNNKFRSQTNEMHTTRHRHRHRHHNHHIHPKRYRDFRYTTKSMNDVSTSSYDVTHSGALCIRGALFLRLNSRFCTPYTHYMYIASSYTQKQRSKWMEKIRTS